MMMSGQNWVSNRQNIVAVVVTVVVIVVFYVFVIVFLENLPLKFGQNRVSKS